MYHYFKQEKVFHQHQPIDRRASRKLAIGCVLFYLLLTLLFLALNKNIGVRQKQCLRKIFAIQRMEVLSSSRVALTLLGFKITAHQNQAASLEKQKLWLRILTKIHKHIPNVIQWTIGLLILSATICSVYFVYRVKQPDLKFLHFVFSVFMGCNFCLLLWTRKNLKIASEVLSRVVKELSQPSVDYLRRSDRIGLTIRLILHFIPGFGSTVYLFTSSTVGSLFFDEVYNGSMCVTILHFCGISLSFTLLVVMSQFYIGVLMVGKVCAEQTKTMFRDVYQRQGHLSMKKTVLLDVKSRLEQYYSFVNDINQTLGVIPLAMFACLFATFSDFFTGASLNSRINLGFIIIVFGATIVNQVLSIIQAVTTAEKANKAIEEAVKFANSMSTEPIEANTPMEVVESRRSLTVFLQQQTIVPFTAQSMFVLKPFLLLSFCNAVIPFTVMITTTIAQFKRDNN